MPGLDVIERGVSLGLDFVERGVSRGLYSPGKAPSWFGFRRVRSHLAWVSSGKVAHPVCISLSEACHLVRISLSEVCRLVWISLGKRSRTVWIPLGGVCHLVWVSRLGCRVFPAAARHRRLFVMAKDIAPGFVSRSSLSRQQTWNAQLVSGLSVLPGAEAWRSFRSVMFRRL